MNQYTKKAELFLRIGLAFVFVYAAVSSFLSPNDWIGYYPIFLRNLIDNSLLLNATSVSEIILSIWVLSGYKVMYSSLLSTFALLGIVITNLGSMDIVFRDVGLAFSSISLFLLSKKEK